MIKCICIDDSNKPFRIPENKWLKEGNEYHITYVTVVLPQEELAFELAEVNLGSNCLPFRYFLAKRFAIRQSDLEQLTFMLHNADDLTKSIDELVKQVEVVTE